VIFAKHATKPVVTARGPHHPRLGFPEILKISVTGRSLFMTLLHILANSFSFSRYRCLEAIVKGAFPKETIEITADLLSLGERLHYEMPDLSSGPTKRLEELIKYSRDDASHPSFTKEPERSTGAASEEPETSLVQSQRRLSGVARLVKDTAGHVHYIGPTGSLTFFAELRDLVGTYQQNFRRTADSASDFAQDNLAEALETEEGHEDNPIQQQETGEDLASPKPAVSPASNYTTGASGLDLDEQLRHLPPRNIMEVLIASYFDHCHHDLPLFHRATFQDQYEYFILHAQQSKLNGQSATVEPTSAARPDYGWLACLHMILVFGSLSKPTSSRMSNFDYRTARRVSIAAAHSFLPSLITKCTLSNIQAILLLSFYFHNNNDRNAAWTLVGTATRMSFALGLHQNELETQFRPVERETRKRIWCSLFTFEQFLCSSLGRPSGIDDPDVEVRVPVEGLLDGGTGAGEQFAEASLKLQYILASARRLTFKRPRKADRNGSTFQNGHSASAPTVECILKGLEDWRNNLPFHLRLPIIDSTTTNSAVLDAETQPFELVRLSLSRQTPRQLRALILLHIQYHYIIMLVSRSALLVEIASSSASATGRHRIDVDNTDTLPDSSQNPISSSSTLASRSVSAAAQIASLTLLLQSFSLLNGTSGFDIFYAYSSAMVLLLRTLWAKHHHRLTEADEESERKKALRALEANLREAVEKANKSKTMERFAAVMKKFGAVVSSINSSRDVATICNDAACETCPKRRIASQSQTLVSSDEGQTFHASTIPQNVLHDHGTSLNPAAGAGEQSDQSLHSSRNNNGNKSNASFPGTSISAIDNSTASLPLQGHRSDPSLDPIIPSPSNLNSRFSYQFSPPGVGVSSSNSMMTNGLPLWHDAPLDALTNGFVVDWTDLDAFMGGQL
jgi:hypothetical protein